MPAELNSRCAAFRSPRSEVEAGRQIANPIASRSPSWLLYSSLAVRGTNARSPGVILCSHCENRSHPRLNPLFGAKHRRSAALIQGGANRFHITVREQLLAAGLRLDSPKSCHLLQAVSLAEERSASAAFTFHEPAEGSEQLALELAPQIGRRTWISSKRGHETNRVTAGGNDATDGVSREARRQGRETLERRLPIGETGARQKHPQVLRWGCEARLGWPGG